MCEISTPPSPPDAATSSEAISAPPWLPLAETFILRLRQEAQHAALKRKAEEKARSAAEASKAPDSSAADPARHAAPDAGQSADSAADAAREASPSLDGDAVAEIEPDGDDCPGGPAGKLIAADQMPLRPPGDPQVVAVTQSGLRSPALAPASLSLTLRLAAAIRTSDILASWLDPGAITRIAGTPRAELAPLTKLIREIVLPRGLSVADCAEAGPGKSDVILLSATTDDRYFQDRSFIREIEAALDGRRPVILLEPSEFRMPAHLAAALPDALTLPTLDRAILFQHLRASPGVSGADPAEIIAALPADRDLARLTPPQLMVAFRAQSVWDIVARLHRMLPVTAVVPGPRLEDIAGNGPALSAARRMIADLQSWQRGQIGWGDFPHSLLLTGPPGTGKTWLARAMGGSAGIGFHQASFAAWQSAGHLGEMLEAMRRTFTEALRNPPAILFIDEIDAVGSREDDDRHARSYRRQVINGFLEQIDLLMRTEGVLLIGACNEPSVLDPAILRPGRFDLHAEVPLPDTEMIRTMFAQALARDLPALAAEIQDAVAEEIGIEEVLDDLTHLAVGRSAAAIDAAIRDARSRARSRDSESPAEAVAQSGTLPSGSAFLEESSAASLPASIGPIARHPLRLVDLHAAFGASSRQASQALDWRICVHECGHAIACAALNLGSVRRIALTEDGGSIARDLRPVEGILSDMEDEIAYSLAGRAAEILILGSPSSGAGLGSSSDLAQATQLALAIETRLGLGIYGSMWIEDPSVLMHRDKHLRACVRDRLAEAERQVLRIVSTHRELLIDMARDLMRKRRFEPEDMRPWFARVTRDTEAEVRRTSWASQSIHSPDARPTPTVAQKLPDPDQMRRKSDGNSSRAGHGGKHPRAAR